MKKVTSADSLVTINHYKNVLISEGIPAFIRNEHLGGILGEMPFQEVWPELWVENDLDYTFRGTRRGRCRPDPVGDTGDAGGQTEITCWRIARFPVRRNGYRNYGQQQPAA